MVGNSLIKHSLQVSNKKYLLSYFKFTHPKPPYGDFSPLSRERGVE